MPPRLSARPVVIDTDPGIDDALALMLALRSPELQVELITTVAGNVPVQTATDNARRLVALLNPSNWPVIAQGAARPLRRPLQTATAFHDTDGLGGLTQHQQADGTPRYPLPAHHTAQRQAVQRLLTAVSTYRQELTVIALGPLTNLAQAIRQAPETMQQLGRLVIMGGAITVPGNVTAVAEFNMFVDPHAADMVFSSGIPITLIPLDVTQQVRLTPDTVTRLVRGSDTVLTQAVRLMLQYVRRDPQRQAGLSMHDPLAVATAIDPTLVTCTAYPLRVEAQGRQTLGMTVADRRDPARQETSSGPVDIALAVDAPRVLGLFAERVLSCRPPGARQQAPQAGVIVVGSANTDLTVRTVHLPHPGETVHGSALYTAYGGKGANQAVAAQRAGARVRFVAKLGQDRYGQEYTRYLQQEGLDTAGIRWAPELPSGLALITVDRRGANQITVAPGANTALTPDDLAGMDQSFPPGTVLLTQLEIPLPTVEAALRRGKAAGFVTILNPAPARPLPRRLARLVDILTPNEVEASMLCGQPVKTVPHARTAARLLQQTGYGTVVITLGKQGVVYATGETAAHLPGFPVQAQDTTAAGDTFAGYLACALAEGLSLAEALRLACAAGAISVMRSGAQPSIPPRAEVQRFLAARGQATDSGISF